MLGWVLNLGFAGGSQAAQPEPEVYAGGWEHHPWKYRPRRRFKFEDEEEKKAAKVIEDIIESEIEHLPEPLEEIERDVEIALRLRLQTQALAYRRIYKQFIIKELRRIQKQMRRQREEEELAIAMLIM